MSNNATKLKEITKFIKIKDLVDSPYQGRFTPNDDAKDKGADHIAELAQSIDQNGLMMPIIVRQKEEGYEIIDGHQRVLAMRKLGRGQIMAIIKDCTEREAQLMHVIGNLQRKNLKPIEQAITYQKLLNAGIFKDKRELSNALSKDETYVGDLLATLQLDSRIIDELAKSNLIKDMRMLRLIRLYEPVDENGVSNAQWELYKKVVYGKMNRQKLMQHLKRKNQPKTVQSYRLKTTKRNITVVMDTGTLDPARKEQLLALINEKIKEIMEGL